MALRIFLALSALAWLPYGLYCFIRPEALAETAGVAATSATASTELRAMYGGLQAAIGTLAALAVFRPAFERPALIALAFLCGGLGSARLLGAFLDAELSRYTGFGLAFEFAMALASAWLLTRVPRTLVN